MTEHTQTRLGIQNSHRSPTKVRQLSPDQMGIPSGEAEEEQDEESRWESLRETAVKTADKPKIGVAVRTEKGTVSTGIYLTKGTSRDIHPLELAVWKGYEEARSPVVDVAIATKNLDIPCGRCLQVLRDYSLDEEPTIQITDGDVIKEHSLTDLLP